MTDADRIKRLETAVERLCDIIGRVEARSMGFGGLNRPVRTDLELIKQYVRGDLEPKSLDGVQL